MIPWHESWRDYTVKEINAIKKAKCQYCPYVSHMSVGIENLHGAYCDYLARTGEARGVRPEFCEHYLDKDPVDKRPQFHYGTMYE